MSWFDPETAAIIVGAPSEAVVLRGVLGLLGGVLALTYGAVRLRVLCQSLRDRGW